MKKILFTLFIISSLGSYAQTAGTFTDPRDGQVYKTITIEDPLKASSVTWMAQNLNYKVDNSYAYNNDETYRKGLGLLYLRSAAFQACPKGWHIPTNDEWKQLIAAFGNEFSAAKAMRSKSGWGYIDNDANSSGFNGLPGGCITEEHKFSWLGEGCYWWTIGEVEHAAVILKTSGIEVSSMRNRGFALSLRCIKD